MNSADAANDKGHRVRLYDSTHITAPGRGVVLPVEESCLGTPLKQERPNRIGWKFSREVGKPTLSVYGVSWGGASQPAS